MQKNEWIALKIEDMGTDGSGIGRHENMIFFVKDAVIGDRVLAKITKIRKNYGYARLMEIQEASPVRVEPRCLFARVCGGCQLQQLEYGSQLLFKQKEILEKLVRIGKFDRAEAARVMEPMVGMEEPYGYRNKAQFPIGTGADGLPAAGFYMGRTHRMVANTDCALGVSANRDVLEAVLSYMRMYGVSAYDENSQTGLVRHVLIRYGFDSGQIMACLVVNGKSLPDEPALLEKLCRIDGMTSILLNTNMERTNVILGRQTRTLWGEDAITDALYLRDTDYFCRIGGKTEYRISAHSFYQINPIQTEKLYSLVLLYAGLTGAETVWDLYCGIGTISLFLAGRAKWVYGVESVEQAVSDARDNAKRNGISNVSFFHGRAEDVLPEFGGAAQRPDVIVVDPPRKGCDKKCLEVMLQMQPMKIVYVSCDPATLSRDLRILCDGGYEMERVRGVDQFGQTVHVETCVLLSRKKTSSKSTRIEIDIDLDEADRRECIGKATYQEIKDYIWEHCQAKVSHLYIAQIKKKCGLDVGENFNKPKTEGNRIPNCPPEKERMIREALKYYGMIKED